MATKILIIEDEAKIARFLSLELAHEGYEVESRGDGREGLDLALAQTFDLIVLDIMLPGLSGMEVLRRLRAVKSTPVLVLTARDGVTDKVMGLDLGADDYMTKPFAIEELLARLRTILKRAEPSAPGDPDVKRAGGLAVNTAKRAAEYGGYAVELTRKEFDLLLYLVENKNKVLSRVNILDFVWGYDFYGDTNVVDVYIRYLRSKIDDRFGVKLIQTMRGAGYIIRDE
jgi:DNA-binding response OmpR family regulator